MLQELGGFELESEEEESIELVEPEPEQSLKKPTKREVLEAKEKAEHGILIAQERRKAEQDECKEEQ